MSTEDSLVEEREVIASSDENSDHTAAELPSDSHINLSSRVQNISFTLKTKFMKVRKKILPILYHISF